MQSKVRALGKHCGSVIDFWGRGEPPDTGAAPLVGPERVPNYSTDFAVECNGVACIKSALKCERMYVP